MLAPDLEDDESASEYSDESETPELAFHLKGMIRNPAPTKNSFASLGESDDDEADMLQALLELTPNLSLASKKLSQKQRRKARVRFAHVNAIAAKVKSGEIDLPDTDDTNDEFEEVYALVDSGAGVNVCKRTKHFPGAKLREAAHVIKMTTATNEEITSGGEVVVPARTQEGHTVTTVFQDADVDMPILSVAVLSASGPMGSDVRFKKHDGYIEDIATGKRCKFIKRQGVYFIKLLVPKNLVTHEESGFAGLEQP